MLLVLALPVFSIRLLFADAGNDPPNLTTRQAYDLLADGFGPGTNGPLVVAVDLAGGGPGVADQLATAIRSTPGVAAVVPPQVNDSGDTAVIVAIPRSSPQDEATKALVERLRGHVIPPVVGSSGAQALVGGVTAAGVDAAQYFSQRLIWVIGGVVLLSFLLLMVVFRSIAIPVKAAVMNMLSIAAAYGVTVAVFQWGWLGSVIGVQKGPIDPWIPLFLFTILFGLSMDYEVFLLSRIREQWLRTGDNARAVADGLALTARVITAAAAIMFCVFGVIRDRRRTGAQGVRPRPGGGGPGRRHHHPVGAGPGDHGAAGQGQLVAPQDARPGAAPRRRRRTQRGRSTPRAPAWGAAGDDRGIRAASLLRHGR